MRIYCLITIFLFSLLASGCAGLLRHESSSDPRDPWEGTNRAIFKFNESVDKTILKPLAQGYERNVPQPMRMHITNFFSNLGDFMTAIQHALQLDFRSSAESAVRFLVNSTVGIFGFNDVASTFGVAKTDEDTGQTLGVYGVSTGPYVVLPFFGPSSVRDGLGGIVDLFANPLNDIARDTETKVAVNALRGVEARARVLSAEQAFEALAFDRYVAMRSAYFAIRKAQIED
ncbi:VacJ family lipoprotein [Betaproteobacteria bacterium]|nr:VacJ family lipoprotein [Betaproteobacteria bacterium]